jgi:hypothetical protein
MTALAPDVASWDAFLRVADDVVRRSVSRADSGCWEWNAVRDPQGYGRITRRRKRDRIYLAHRYVYQLMGGELIAGLVLDHLCRVRHCVNPAHLDQVTQAENVRRAWADYDTCVNGHSLADAYMSTGRRDCATCRKAISQRVGAAARARKRALGITDSSKFRDHCKHGHEYTPENTRVVRDADGKFMQRSCRTCQSAADKRSKARRRAEKEAAA